MKTHDEIIEELFDRRKKYIATKKKQKRILYYSITSLCVAVVLVIGIVMVPFQSRNLPSPNITNQESVVYSASSLNNSSETLPNTVVSSQNDVIQNTVSSGTSQNPSNDLGNSSTPPSLQQQSNFSSLDEFVAYLPQLDIKIENSDKNPDTSIPNIPVQQPNQNFWGNGFGVGSNTGEKPDNYPGFSGESADSTSEDATQKPTNTEIWEETKVMFNNGYYSIPYFREGNDLLYLHQIFVQKNTIRYHYKFKETNDNIGPNDCLSIQLYNYSIQSTFNEYINKYPYKVMVCNGITYTVFQLSDNMYNACVFWNQNGFHCRANYNGNDMYLSTIIPQLYLINIPWTNS